MEQHVIKNPEAKPSITLTLASHTVHAVRFFKRVKGKEGSACKVSSFLSLSIIVILTMKRHGTCDGFAGGIDDASSAVKLAWFVFGIDLHFSQVN